MWEDPIVGEIRRIREVIAARHNYDIKAICRAAREREMMSDREVVTLPSRPVARPQLENQAVPLDLLAASNAPPQGRIRPLAEEVLGLWNPGGVAPTDEECEQILFEELQKKHGPQN